MKMLISLDLFLWNNLMPKINADIFKFKPASLLAIFYISLFYLPRKFLINYFRGKEKKIVVDTREVITGNNEVLSKLINAIQCDKNKSKFCGTLSICQTDVYNPNYKYSIGSFRINYQQNGETVNVTIQSKYRFQESSGRITKHLHNWLIIAKNSGRASEFKVQGKCWQTNLQELRLLKLKNQNQKSPKFKLLV